MNVKIDKHISRVIRWLKNGCSTDPVRPILTRIGVFADHMGSANGFTYFVANMECPVQGLESGTACGITKPKLTKDAMLELEAFGTGFPEAIPFIPDKPPVFEIHVNPKLLRDALQYQEERVCLRFYDKTGPFEIYGRIETKVETKPRITDTYTLVMPMHPGYDQADDYYSEHWRPREQGV